MTLPNSQETSASPTLAPGSGILGRALSTFLVLLLLPHSAAAWECAGQGNGQPIGRLGLNDVSQVAVDGTHAYVTRATRGGCNWGGCFPDYSYVIVIDISDPGSPKSLGYAGWVGYDNRSPIEVNNGFVYVGGDFFRVIDASNPSSPVSLGSWDLGSGFIEDIEVQGTYAYLTDAAGLEVVDLTTPASPQKIGGVSMPGAAHAVVVSGTYAYVADDEFGVEVVDISIPDSPIVVGAIVTEGRALDIAVRGSHVYVASEGGLEILNVARPASPVHMGSMLTSGGAGRIALNGARAYLGSNDLLVVDISNPRQPTLRNKINYVSYGWYAGVTGVATDDAYVAVVGYTQFLDCIGVLGDCRGTWFEVGRASAYECTQGDPSRSAQQAMGSAAVTRLGRGYPNPVRASIGSSSIDFALARASRATLRVFDASGRLVRTVVDATLEQGPHTARWDCRDELGAKVASGVYFYRLEAGGYAESRRLVLLP